MTPRPSRPELRHTVLASECDETRMLRTRFGAIPCPNCNPAAEEAS